VPESLPFAAAIEYSHLKLPAATGAPAIPAAPFSHPKVFRIGGMGSALTGDAMPTGYAALDAELAGGGWQRPGLTEILCNHVGIGELSLLMRGLGAGAGVKSLRPGDAAHVLWVLPPGQAWVPYAPALARGGVSLAHLAIVRTKNSEDALWAAEQGLRSGACAAVLWWQAEARAPAAALATALRRLHLAAQEGGCPLFALRPASVRGQSSPAPLRLVLEPAPQGQLAVTVFKRRGPAMVQPLLLTLPVAGLPAGRALRRVPPPVLPARVLLSEPGDAVVRTAPERIAA